MARRCHSGPTIACRRTWTVGYSCLVSVAFLTHLYTPETYEGFSASQRNIAGFPKSQQKTVSKVRPGDTLIYYMTKLSRWVGALIVLDSPFEDDSAIFTANVDRFIVRFHV